MASGKMSVGILGLGRMGGNLPLQAVEKGITVVGKARSGKPELEEKGVKVVGDYESFVSQLEKPKFIYLSLPAGSTASHRERSRRPSTGRPGKVPKLRPDS